MNYPYERTRFLFRMLVELLPATAEPMTEERREQFVKTFRSFLDLVYPEPAPEGSISGAEEADRG